MPLMIGGGEGKPYIRFSPSINSWEMSTPDGRTEFTWDAPVVFDVHGLQLGWMRIDAQGRDWQPWPSLNQRAPSPGEEYKIGFKIDVVSNKLFGDEPTREFSANTFGPLQFISALYDACENAEEFKAGQVPVIKITGSKPVKVGKGNTRVPEFEIAKWVPRPDELAASDEGVTQSAAPAQAQAKPEPTPVVEDDEF